MKILLIEPGYKAKYPPLGLMKISQYHKRKKHEVIFRKGLCPDERKEKWDRIYISSLFTFYWKKTIKTIKYYKNSVKNPSNIYVGGAMATLLADDIKKEIGITPIKGLLNKPGMLGYKDKIIIDALVPDYAILDDIEYKYAKSNAYIAYMTRSCPNNCEFCAVRVLEPTFNFNGYISIKRQIRKIAELYDEKKDLLLLDNNVLASKKFQEIIEEIKEMGFAKGAKLERKRKYVDFNQGLDGRRLTKEKMRLLSEIAIKPLRIAFDDIKHEKTYMQKIRWAAEYEINNLSNYILFNFRDTPEDFYRRLQVNIELNEEFSEAGYKTKIWSFPMKFVPLYGEDSKNRKYVGKHWNKKYLRGIQCILLATHGVVGPKRPFFEKAFGRNIKEFKEILLMPEDYIIHRINHEKDGSTNKWRKKLYGLRNQKLRKVTTIIKKNVIKNVQNLTDNVDIKKVLKHYENRGIS
jgi:hypothetical protein